MGKMETIKTKIKRMGLKQKTVMFTMLFFLFVVILSSVTFFFIYKNMRKETIEKAMDSVVRQKKDEIEGYFDNLETLAYSLGYSAWMQTLTQKSSLDPRTMQEIEQGIKDFLTSVVNMNGDMKLAAIMENGIRLNSPSGYLDYSIDLKQEDWYPEFMRHGKYIEEGEGKGVYTKGTGWYLNIYYPINNQYSMRQEGILVITIPHSGVLSMADMGIDGEYMRLKNEKGVVIADKIPEKVQNEVEKGISVYNVRNEDIDIGGKTWQMEIVLDTASLVVDSRNIWIGFTMVLLLGALFFVLAAVLFSRYLTAPILQCRDSMIKIRNNQMGINMENHYHDEIGEMIDGFNEMSDSILDLIEKNKIISTLQKETEYQMLLQQINPHFLYNTLEIINGLILSKKETEAVAVCETLGQIFHYNLKQDKWIKVKDEMAYIRRYLLLMEYKIPDLSIFYDVDGSVEERLILKAVLQPLVENCIKHGFAGKTGECCITIAVKEETDGLQISVMDNGNGITREKYISLLKELEKIKENPNQKKESSAHIGIWNVFHRLYLEYGDSMQFHIMAKENLGTRIQIKLPGGTEDV